MKAENKYRSKQARKIWDMVQDKKARIAAQRRGEKYTPKTEVPTVPKTDNLSLLERFYQRKYGKDIQAGQ